MLSPISVPEGENDKEGENRLNRLEARVCGKDRVVFREGRGKRREMGHVVQRLSLLFRPRRPTSSGLNIREVQGANKCLAILSFIRCSSAVEGTNTGTKSASHGAFLVP